MTWFLLAVFWIGCGYLSYGLAYAHFQRTYPYIAEEYRDRDHWKCAVMATTGPFNLCVIFLLRYWEQGFLTRSMQRKQEEASG